MPVYSCRPCPVFGLLFTLLHVIFWVGDAFLFLVRPDSCCSCSVFISIFTVSGLLAFYGGVAFLLLVVFAVSSPNPAWLLVLLPSSIASSSG
jgi:hypothetical protein